MKILYLAPDPIEAPKGAAVRIQHTVAALADLGHDVERFTPPAGPDADGGTNFLDKMLALRARAARWLDGRQADLVQFRSVWEGASALAWAKGTGARAVFELHGLPSIELQSHFPSLSRHAVLDKIIADERRVLAASDRVLVPSRTTARFALRLGVPPERLAVVPNAVDVDRFTPPLALPPSTPPFRLVYVGTLAPWQGLETLLEALALLRGRALVELHLVGPVKSAWSRALRALARRLRVHHALQVSGPMAQADLLPVLHTAHVCVAPLAGDARNVLQGCCPLKLLEYMAAGRPILTTRVPPVEEIVEHGATAHVVRAGSAAALAAGLAWMIDHPEEREALGRRARDEAMARWTPRHFRERLAAALQ